MRTLDDSRRRWEELQKDGRDLATLRQAVKYNGPTSPCEASFRSVCWKIFLLYGDAPVSDRNLMLRDAREDYEALRVHYMQYVKHPELLAELTVDPLADDPESPWDTFRRDELVRAEILQDVRRLPDDPFYHREDIQMSILDILFVFCKHNPDVGGYRQGMHELLAPIVYVLNEDAIEANNLLPAPEAADADMVEMLDGRFIEHDAYTLFTKVMESSKSFYETNNTPTMSAHAADPASADELHFIAEPTHSTGVAEESTIVELSKEIHEGTLMKVDPELAVYLKNIEVLPQIFLIRWIRLLFGREFPFEQHLILWDSIFAFDPKLHLVPLICVAMLLRIRWQLLEADYSLALQSLLKYPAPQAPHGPHTFVDDALFLRDHLDATGGASLILKYTGRSPARVLSPSSSSLGSGSRPSTPAAAFAAGLGSLRSRTLKAARSPLRVTRPGSRSGDGLGGGSGEHTSPSPSRFIQSREGMEALFQGAAKGVLDRGEKLGINRAVRDAVGEIKRNMAQSFQEARQAAAQRGPGISGPDVFSPAPSNRRLSYGQAIRAVADMEQRNRQLAAMLDETIMSLRAIAKSTPEGVNYEGRETQDKTVSNSEERQQSGLWLESVELAAAKVQFVKVYLEDASLVLPSDEPTKNDPDQDIVSVEDENKEAPEPALSGQANDLLPAAEVQAASQTPEPQTEPAVNDVGPLGTLSDTRTMTAQNQMDVDLDEGKQQRPVHPAATSPAAPLERLSAKTTAAQNRQNRPETSPAQQPHTIPTRSTLAQSSFSWMLEPGDSASSVGGLASSSHASSSLSSKKSQSRPNPAVRSRNAFLFGEIVNQSPLGGSADSGDSFHDPLAGSQLGGPDGKSRSITGDEVFGLEPLRRSLPKSKD